MSAGFTYPPIGVRTGSPEWVEHMLAQPEPHVLERPYSCSCVKCMSWRGARVAVGSVVVGYRYDPRAGSGMGGCCWRCDEEPMFSNQHVSLPSLVLGAAEGVATRRDMQCVVILVPNMGLRVTNAEWLVVLAGGATVKAPALSW